MSRKRSLPVVLTGLTLALFACEGSITAPVVPEVGFQAVHPAALVNANCVVPGAGLISWWPGEGNYDDIAPPRDVTVDPDPNPIGDIPRNGDSADPTAVFEAGMVGQAFRFAGVQGQRGHYLEVSDAPDLQPASFTVDLWAQRLGEGQGTGNNDVFGSMLIQKAIDDDVLGTGTSYYISWRGDGRVVADVGFGSQAGAPRLIGRVVPRNTWVHVALTVDANLTARLYLDGVFQAEYTGTAGVLYGGGSVVIGNNWFIARVPPNHYNRGFDGRIDELDLFEGALSAQEIAAIHGAGADGKCTGDNTAPIVDEFEYHDDYDDYDERSGKSEKSYKSGKSYKSDKSDKSEKSEKSEKSGNQGR